MVSFIALLYFFISIQRVVYDREKSFYSVAYTTECMLIAQELVFTRFLSPVRKELYVLFHMWYSKPYEDMVNSDFYRRKYIAYNLFRKVPLYFPFMSVSTSSSAVLSDWLLVNEAWFQDPSTGSSLAAYAFHGFMMHFIVYICFFVVSFLFLACIFFHYRSFAFRFFLRRFFFFLDEKFTDLRSPEEAYRRYFRQSFVFSFVHNTLLEVV